jgi:transcriptional regulator with XRE-family HTH domain
METIGDRIKKIMTLKGLNPNKIATLAKIHPSTVKNYIDNTGIPDNLRLDKVAIVLGVNAKWLLTGEGKMFNEENTNIDKVAEDPEKYKTSKKEVTKIGVPYYDVDFTAGFLEVENSSSNIPDSYISHPFFKGCDYVVRASGQSMAKVICHGDAIGLVKIENWREFFPFGEIYAIVTKDNFRMVKVITKGENEDSYTLISKPTDSKKDEFPPQQIKKQNISALFKVQAASHLF